MLGAPGQGSTREIALRVVDVVFTLRASGLFHLGEGIQRACEIDLELIRIAFSGLIPVGGDSQTNAEQCTLQLVNYLQEYELLPKLPGDRNLSLPGKSETQAVTVPAAAEEAETAEAPAEQPEPKKSTWL